MPSSTRAFARSIDEHVAGRLRRARELRHLTQSALGDAVGVAFQQIQKYETAAVRVSAGRLFQLAKILNVPISYFYADIVSADTEGETDNTVIVDITSLSSAKAEAVQRLIKAADPDAETISSLLLRLEQNFSL